MIFRDYIYDGDHKPDQKQSICLMEPKDLKNQYLFNFQKNLFKEEILFVIVILPKTTCFFDLF